MSKRPRKHNHSHASHHAKRGLRRWQKNLIHFGLIAVIAASLWYEGAKTADLGFFLLSIATELS